MSPHDIALAYSLSTVAGLRASLTILAVAVAVHFHVFVAPASLQWLASDTTLVVAGVFTLVEFFGDKFPGLDHGLHLVHTILAPASGAVAAAALDPSGNTTGLVAVAALGAVNALGIHSVRSVTRVGSSAVSFGALNPVVSFVEDALAVGSLVLSFLAPFVFAVVAIIATAFAIVRGRRLARWIQQRRIGTAAVK